MASPRKEEDREIDESGDEYQEDDFSESSEEDPTDFAERKPDELQAAEMEALRNVTEGDVEGGDTELILFRIPRHTRLRGALKDSKFHISVADNVIGKKLAVYQGSYVLRDRGIGRCEQVRPIFVTESETGKPYLQMGKKFSRFFTVTFDMKLSSLSDQRPMPRMYPKTKEDLKLKYHPLGKILPNERSLNSETGEANHIS
ncbi:hypothetical protein FGB62_23g23 [Gracilaria domingensis]|nr:hypothetical protein FGB62_23g23 [Gracilaria domingensis]